MPAAKLPKKLSARLGFLADRVRKIRTLRAVARAAFVIPVVAFACVLADAYLGFPAAVRYALLGGWGVLVLHALWQIRRARTAAVDLEAVASAVEEEFPRLAERLTTAVELAGSADASNGSPALIEEVIRDADSRARKLDLAVAFPTGGVVAGFFAAMALLLVLVAPVFFAPHGGEYLRRFFAPWYTPAVRVDYKLVVTSGDPAVKRGDPVTLSAYVEPTKAGAQLPASAVAIVTANGKDERLPMTADEPNVWHLKRSAAGEDFDYRIEAGGAASEPHHVTVVEPVTLAAARVTVKPPAYAALGRDPEAAVEGLGELAALQHGTITFDLRFHPRPETATLDFTPDGKEDAKPAKVRTRLTVAADGTVRVTVPARESGTFALTAEGPSGVRSEFPAQPLRVHPDEAPKFPHVAGLGDKAKKVRPTEKVVVSCAATDDVAVAALAFEYRVNDGPTRRLPLDARNLNTGQAEGKLAVSLVDKAKVGDKFQCRLVATDNRSLPDPKLAPQSTYFPAADWSDFEVDPAAAPLAEQEILQKKAEIEKALKDIRADVKEEKESTDLLRRGTEKKPLDAAGQEKLRKTAALLNETIGKTEDLAKDVAVTPELARLADQIGRLAGEPLRDAETALAKAKDPAKADEQNPQLRKAEDALARALRKIDDLLKETEQTAQDRLDKRKLEGLADDQRALADRAKAADPKDAADLAEKQKALADELNKLKEQSDAIKKAADASKADDAQKLADEARKIADEMRDLNKAIRKTETDPAGDKLADLRKRQADLARKAKELADRTDAASRAAETPPLKPDDAAAAKEALDKGDLDEAATAQEKARQELERLARDLEEAAANARDPREAAKQLARLQDDLRRRLAQETAKTPLDKLPADRRAALAKQQEAIAKAVARIKTPDQGTEAAKQQAARDAADAKNLLDKGVANEADRKMQEAKESLDKLADRLPTKDQRLAKAKDDLAKLKPQQDDLRQRAEAATKAAERQDPDAPATQRDVARKLADAAQKQADLADQLNKLDAPGQDARKEKAADAMQRAAADMTAGRPQDVAASQAAAKRELERLEQALNGQQPADDKVAELAKKQKAIADEAAKTPDKAAQGDLAKRQEEVARDLAKVPTPEAATAQAEAADAAKKAADAGRDGAKPEDFAKKAKAAADKLDKLDERVNGKENPAAAADRLAKKQRENADAQAKKPDNAGTGEARKKAAQELDELKNLRAGADAQKAKQQAQEALQKAANHMDPAANTKAQKEAADALKGLADKLAGDPQAKADPKAKDPADAAEQLAKKQRDLAEKTQKDADAAKQKPGAEGQQAKKEALQKAAAAQKDLGKQAGEMAGRDSPNDLQQAQDAMAKAQEELDRENAEGAVKKQKEAADALDRLSREAQKAKEERADDGHPGVPNQQQADAAKQLAEEQKKLRDEAQQAAAEQKAQGARTDNPVADVAKQQQEIAKQAGELAKTVADRQGEKAEPSKQARQAADAAKQTADRVKDGDLNQAKESGKQAAEALEKLAGDKAGGESGQKAKDLARQQADVNQKLEAMAKDGGAGKAQQAARQEQLEKQAREVGQKLDAMGKPADAGVQPSPAGLQAKEAGASAKEAGDQMQAAQQAGKKGDRPQAGEAREGAAEAMEKAAQQAQAAAKQMAGGDKPGSPGAGKALGDAQDQMGEAGKRLGGGQPGEAGGAMEKAADALQKAAGQLGQPGPGEGPGEPGKPGKDPGGKTPGGNVGGPGGTLDLRPFGPDVAKYTGKPWGELPGEIKTKVIQEMKARYGEDYARNIKLYFEQLAERK